MNKFLYKIFFLFISLFFLDACGSSDTNEEKTDKDILSIEPSLNCTNGENLFPVNGTGNFKISDNTISFIIHALSDSNLSPSFDSVSSPNGIDIKSIYSQKRSDIPWRGEKYSNFFVPISSNYQLISGTWNYSTSSSNTLCFITRENSISDIPTIIVQPYISGSNYSSDNITSALNIMNNIYSKNNVKLNILETTSITESKFSNVSYKFTNSITSEMVSKGDEDKVNLFFITDYDDAAYLGNAAGIPGSQGLKGSHNGVLINLKAHEYDNGSGLNNQLLGETAAHEMGHFLGLWHPTEGNQYKIYGLDYDPISDTPECPESKNSNNDIHLSSEECGQQYGADNLMFWDSWDDGNQDNLTEGQVYVLKRALIAK